MGVDTWAAEIVIELKQQKEYKDIRLCAAVPFPSFQEKFDVRQQARLQNILRKCDEQIVISDTEFPRAYRIRNEYIVRKSDCILAVYNRNSKFYTDIDIVVDYALKTKLPIIYIHPDTAAISK